MIAPKFATPSPLVVAAIVLANLDQTRLICVTVSISTRDLRSD
jgi:hypothetical protein